MFSQTVGISRMEEGQWRRRKLAWSSFHSRTVVLFERRAGIDRIDIFTFVAFVFGFAFGKHCMRKSGYILK